MSLNKTLDRLFDEIRREAKRNPDFADRLDAVLRLHESRRDVADDVVEDVARDGAVEMPSVAAVAPQPALAAAPIDINPAGLYKRKGEDALTEALVTLDLSSLQALVAEHNLDPSGVAGELDAPELVTHIVAQAKKRAERDDKMFDY